MGDDLRRDYAGFRYYKLRTALGKRRKVIEVSEQVCRTWVTQYGAPAPEAAAASGAASSSGIRNLVGAKAVEEAHIYTCVLFAIVLALSSPSVYIDHQAVGARYRLEVTDLGLGVTSREMRQMLLGWGYQVSREACQEPHTLYLILNYLSISHLCIYLVIFFFICTMYLPT